MSADVDPDDAFNVFGLSSSDSCTRPEFVAGVERVVSERKLLFAGLQVRAHVERHIRMRARA